METCRAGALNILGSRMWLSIPAIYILNSSTPVPGTIDPSARSAGNPDLGLEQPISIPSRVGPATQLACCELTVIPSFSVTYHSQSTVVSRISLVSVDTTARWSGVDTMLTLASPDDSIRGSELDLICRSQASPDFEFRSRDLRRYITTMWTQDAI